jgi:hypothetical protein
LNVEWCDASIGKSLGGGGAVDVPVRSVGVFLGVFGDKNRYIVLAQNAFRYTDGDFDIDYTSIPLGWPIRITVVTKAFVEETEAQKLVKSFLIGARGNFVRRTFQQHMRLHHERLD